MRKKCVPKNKTHFDYIASGVKYEEAQGHINSRQHHRSLPNTPLKGKGPFHSNLLMRDCFGPTTKDVQEAAEKERQKKVRPYEYIFFLPNINMILI